MSKCDIMEEIISKAVPIATPINIRYCNSYQLYNDRNWFKEKWQKEVEKIIIKENNLE